jgi:hypothetical protein
MISIKKLTDEIIDKFEIWFANDSTRKSQNHYDGELHYDHLVSLNNDEFIALFSDFIKEGGGIQTGGQRSIEKYNKTVKKEFNRFKAFILSPHQDNFDLEIWFKEIEEYPGFGKGTATIYLNRLDPYTYPILNNKAIVGMTSLGYYQLSTLTFKNYELLKNNQDELLSIYPSLENYFKVDGLMHFLIGVKLGQNLIDNIINVRKAESNIEQQVISSMFNNDLDDGNINELKRRIEDCEDSSQNSIKVEGITFQRSNYLMSLIKKYRGYACQFCETTIKKENGDYYIEACHIKPKAKGGKDKLANILILCPNCHKLLDYGKRGNEKNDGKTFSVRLNGRQFKAQLY